MWSRGKAGDNFKRLPIATFSGRRNTNFAVELLSLETFLGVGSMENLSKLDFGYFIGQVVTSIHTEENQPLGIILEKGWLMVECPWRIRKGKDIILGETDCVSEPEKFSHKNLKKLLISKKILNISFFEQLILIIEFEDNLTFELFHASSYFEGWSFQGDNGFDVFTLPGGKVCY